MQYPLLVQRADGCDEYGELNSEQQYVSFVSAVAASDFYSANSVLP
jgi:hypothetical protein